MRSISGLVALAGEALSAAAVIWVMSATLLQKDNEVPIPGLWLSLLLTALTVAVYLLILQNGIRIPVLAAISAGLMAVHLFVYIYFYDGRITVGYVMTVLLMSMICVYVPLYYCIKEQSLTKHLILIDLMIFSLIWLFLFLSVLPIGTLSIVCAVLVALIDIGGAVCLRMSEGGMKEGTGKAFALAMGASAATAAVVFVLVKLFSRSGGVTGAVLSGIKAFFLKIWELIQAFAEWIFRFVDPVEGESVVETGPAVSGVEQEYELSQTFINPVWILSVLGAVILVIALIAVFRMRKKRMEIRVGTYGGTRIVRQKKKKKGVPLWKKLLDQFIFKKNAFLYRNTPPGVLVWLERCSARKKRPRGAGESVRAFLTRLSPEGTLLALADDLDAGLYGKRGYTLSSAACRELKKQYRREWKNKNRGE